jgi:F-type H+-transporting ATPase subunit b
MPADERGALIEPLREGAAVLRVVTAAPLPEDAAELWRSCLRRILGSGIAISFDADPTLVAGAELHFPNAILRFSWQSMLSTLSSGIEAHADAR